MECVFGWAFRLVTRTYFAVVSTVCGPPPDIKVGDGGLFQEQIQMSTRNTMSLPKKARAFHNVRNGINVHLSYIRKPTNTTFRSLEAATNYFVAPFRLAENPVSTLT